MKEERTVYNGVMNSKSGFRQIIMRYIFVLLIAIRKKYNGVGQLNPLVGQLNPRVNHPIVNHRNPYNYPVVNYRNYPVMNHPINYLRLMTQFSGMNTNTKEMKKVRNIKLYMNYMVLLLKMVMCVFSLCNMARKG